MVEYDRNNQREPEKAGHRICIVGIGGAGSNVLDRITLDRSVEANLVSMHTDIRVLSHSMAPAKVQLGAELMRGVGAGGDPDLGREAAMFSRDEVRLALENHDMIFLCVGLGGGTGSGASPVIAEIAKNTGAMVFVTATMPFSFEGRRRINQAEEALQLLQKRSDALVLFENNRMGELVLPKDGIQKAFSQADQLIAQSLRAVSTIVTMPGLVKLGLDDLTSALSSSNGRCLFGFGESRGQNRGTEALKRALKSPLIDQGRLLHQTKTLLVHIAGGESLTLVEVDGIMKQLGKHVPDQTHILFGVAVDAKLTDSVAVTLISSLGLAQLNAQATAAPPLEMLRHRPAAASKAQSPVIPPEPPPAPAPAKPRVEEMHLFEPEVAPHVAPPPPAPVARQAAPAAPAPEPASRQIAPAAPAPEPAPRQVAPAAPAPEPAPAPPTPPEVKQRQEVELFSAPPAPTPPHEPRRSAAQIPEWREEPQGPGPDSGDGNHGGLLLEPDPEPEHEPEPGPESEMEPEYEPDLEPEPEPEPEAFYPPVRHEPVIDRPLSAPVHEPLPQPVSHPLPRPQSQVNPTPRVSLAAVVARGIPTPPADLDDSYVTGSAIINVKKPANGEQTNFRFGEEDRGRFKDTEPALVQGEDLDVPTWMRLKRKLKK